MKWLITSTKLQAFYTLDLGWKLTLLIICVSAETMEEDAVQQGSLPLRLGVSAHNVQLMKASFFAEEMGEGDEGVWKW